MNLFRISILGFSIFNLSEAQALTLKESVDIALKNNPSVIASQKKVDAANARLSQAVGTFFPTVKLDGNYGKTYTQPSTAQFTMQTATGETTQTITFGTDAATDSRGWTASFSQPLFVVGLFPGIKIAQRSRDVAKEDFKKTALETSFNVAQTHYGVLRAEKMVELSRQSKEIARAHLDKVKVMLLAGAATRADQLRAEVQLANSEVALTRAKQVWELAKNTFNIALGRKLDEKIDLSEKISATIDLPDQDILLMTAMESRPDWKQYLLSKQIGEENLRVLQTAYLPTVLLTGQTGNHVTEYPTYKSDVNSWQVLGVASWTLFDGLGIQNRIREAAANLEAQRATEEQVRNGIALEVREAFLNLKSALETIGSTRKAVDSAEESYKVSNSLYNSGVGTNLEVISAQVSLTQAKMSYYQSLFDLQVAKAKINKVAGKELL